MGKVASTPVSWGQSNVRALDITGTDELAHAARAIDADHLQIELAVADMRCGACVQKIEKCLSAVPGVSQARANLTTHRVRVTWATDVPPPPLIDYLATAGFSATVQDTSDIDATARQPLSRHVKALAVAGFATGNVMMLSVGVWAGADANTRALFHAVSALIAVPALLYAGWIFFESAWQAVRHRHVNMDVPISIGILVTAAMSLYDTILHGDAVYFDAALMLVFFLLVGRTLEQQMRERARTAADAVSRFEPRGAHVVQSDGTLRFQLLGTLRAGDRIKLAPDQRVPVDADVLQGCSTVDRSLVTGESLPVEVAPGARLQAGVLNLSTTLTLYATADAEGSYLADIRRMMHGAEASKGRYRQLADRAAGLYAPVVHCAAALTLLGWLWLTGDLHQALGVSVAVLIITCPCALGLAVPIVQVIAARRLLEIGVLLKEGAALERLAEVDTVVFDKTGTLTTGQLDWERQPKSYHDGSAKQDIPSTTLTKESEARYKPGLHYQESSEASLIIARQLAEHSNHPHARALMKGVREASQSVSAFAQIEEVAGAGIEGIKGADIYRLGRADWALGDPQTDSRLQGQSESGQCTNPGTDTNKYACEDTSESDDERKSATAPVAASSSLLTLNGYELAQFRFHDTPRPKAQRCLQQLNSQQLNTELLSGDATAPVEALATALQMTRYQASALPEDKLAYVQQLEAVGHPVLMVGDGLNDSPALTAASVSIAPGSATDVGRRAADLILLQDRLLSIPGAIAIARRAQRLVRQNILLAVLYNLCAMPLAIAGLVTPLVAAISMSLSSVIVVANALRLTRVERLPADPPSITHSAGPTQTLKDCNT